MTETVENREYPTMESRAAEQSEDHEQQQKEQNIDNKKKAKRPKPPNNAGGKKGGGAATEIVVPEGNVKANAVCGPNVHDGIDMNDVSAVQSHMEEVSARVGMKDTLFKAVPAEYYDQSYDWRVGENSNTKQRTLIKLFLIFEKIKMKQIRIWSDMEK